MTQIITKEFIYAAAVKSAELINSGGQLLRYITPEEIIKSNVKYLIELDKSELVGIIGIHKINDFMSEIKHECVKKGYRGRQLGKRLLQRAIEESETPFVFGRIRSNNIVSLNNAKSLGMIPITEYKKAYYNIIFVARRRV